MPSEAVRLHAALAIAAVAGLVAATGRTVAQDTWETTLNGEIELQRLVDLAADRLGLNIEYDKAQLRGSVTFRLGSPLSSDELWALTNRLLAARGFTTLRRAGESTVGVVPLAEAAGLAQIEEPGEAAADDPVTGFRVLGVDIRHASPDHVVQTLKSFASPRVGSVARVAETNIVILSDLTPRVEQMLSLLGRLDTPGASFTLERIPLASGTAAALVPQLADLVSKRQLAGPGRLPGEALAGSNPREILLLAPRDAIPAWRELVELLDRSQGSETRTYRPRYFTLDDVAALLEDLLGTDLPEHDEHPAWRIVKNGLTGTLIITATPAQHDRVESLLTELAEAPPESRQPIRTFVVRNRDAREIRELVEDLVRGGLLEDDAASASRDGAGAVGAPPGRRVHEPSHDDRRLRLTVDEGTNTLIAAGEPRLLDQLGAVLDQIDLRRPQVMIEVLLVSLTEGQTLDLGVELQQLVSDSGTLVALGSLFGLTNISPFGGGGLGGGPLPSPGGTAVVLDPGDFSAVVRALETVNQGRSLSMPKVLVNDNESASIDSVVQEPFTSTNASDTVATTSFGGFESAGTTVSVTPQIAEGDHLSLQYSISLSSFTGESPDASTPPPRQQNSISSVATIPDGYTIAVGGIEVRNSGEAESRIPVLGQIPLLGELFKTSSRSGSRSRFFAFIRADVLRHAAFEDLKHISAPLRSAAELSPDEPVLRPRVIR